MRPLQFTTMDGRLLSIEPEGLTGYLPYMFSADDPRPAREQINQRYAHGGGWEPQDGFDLDVDTLVARYPGDPPFHAIAFAMLQREMIVLFEHEYLAIVQPDGSFEMARVN
jgi:hypothetical protein